MQLAQEQIRRSEIQQAFGKSVRRHGDAGERFDDLGRRGSARAHVTRRGLAKLANFNLLCTFVPYCIDLSISVFAPYLNNWIG